ncbi:MAG: DUF4062 domain-containing protein [Cyanobium sp.]
MKNPPFPPFRFYISSTFRDLSEQRQMIRDYLVISNNLPVQTVTASADPVLQQCLDDVDSCHAMILLVANSYGTLVDAPDGQRRSITHCEFLHARSKRLPVLAFDLEYINPPEPQTAEQLEGLRILKGELRDLGQIPSLVKKPESLGFEVAPAVNEQIKKLTAAQITDSDGGDLSFGIPIRASKARLGSSLITSEIFLQVQLKPKGDWASNLLLIPEVFVRSSDPAGGTWKSLPEADPEPLENVSIADLSEHLRGLGEEAEQRAFACGFTGFDRLVMELLFPSELLVECIGRQSAADALRQALCDLDMPYLVRSLDRAEICKRAPSHSNRLRNHWNHAHGLQPRLLACSRWPSIAADAAVGVDGIRPFKHTLQDPDGDVTAFVGLVDCPDDRQHIGAILKVLFSSPLPVVLLWLADGAERSLRWSRASELLERALPALPEAAFSNEQTAGTALHCLDLPAKPWCSLETALQRKHLLGASKFWVDHALLVVDCPERWPARLSADPRAAPLQLRRASPA